MTDLKPCPFCGNKEIIDDEDDGITCPNCGTYIDRLSVEDDICLVDVWSTRPIENELKEEIKRLREALELIKEMANDMAASGATYYDLISIRNTCCDALEGWKE